MDVDPVAIVLQALEDMVRGFFASLPQIGIAIVVLILTLIAARIVRTVVASVMKRTGVRNALITLATNLVGIVAWIFGIAIAVMIVFPSVTPAQFIAGLGLTSVAIGFAFKDVFENFLAGVIILGREKMQIGDFIECEGVAGRIENIWIRETHVRKVDGQLVIVPNAFLFKNPLYILTDQRVRRQDLSIGVDYATDLVQARDVMMEAMKGCSSIDASRDIEVKFVGFGASSLDFRLLWWTDSQPRAQRDSYDEVGMAIMAALDKAEIAIPYPQTTVSLRRENWPLRFGPSDTD